MVIKNNEKSYFDDAGATAPAEILSFRAKFCVWNMKILLCSIEQKTQKKSCSTQKNFIQKGQIEQKKR